MRKYAIYNGVDEVTTPSGEVFTAEQWLNRYPWGRKHKMVIGGGVYNGSLVAVFDEFVEMMEKQGCDFSACTTDEEILEAIEVWENRPMPPVVTDETRIADSLEDMVVLQELNTMPAEAAATPMAMSLSLEEEVVHSPQFDGLKQRYDMGRISKNMLMNYVKAGRITESELQEIIGLA